MVEPSDQIEPRTLMLVVVGAHLRAEIADRPIGERLCAAIRQRQLELAITDGIDGPGLRPIVCTDLWYLNSTDLMARPTISIGEPSVNAATAFLSSRLPTTFVMEQAFRIQMDVELINLQACLWGVDAEATAAAVALFEQRYLDEFLRCAGAGV